MHGRDETFVQDKSENTKAKDHLLGVNKQIILKWKRKCVGVNWITVDRN
jgi:hypothetical protein